jgi:hypothetical protein
VHGIVLYDFQKLFECRRLDVNFNQHADHGNPSLDGGLIGPAV